MTLNSSAHRWLKPALWAVLAVALILAWLHLAGAVVLAGVGRNFNAATPLTFILFSVIQGILDECKWRGSVEISSDASQDHRTRQM